MKKNKLTLKKLLIATIIASNLTACTTYTIKDNRVRVHFIKQGEPAPYNGVLLNNYTYYKLKEKAAKCVK